MSRSAWRLCLQATAAVTASAIMCALYARVDGWSFLFGWVAFIPWLAVQDRAPSLRGALVAGLLMCEAFAIAIFGGLAGAIQEYANVSASVGVLVFVLVAPLLQPQLLAFAVARVVARGAATSVWYVALVGACAYVGTEWAFPKLFGDTIGHGLYASAWMRQAADITGAHGLTFVLIIGNECVLALVRGLARGTLRRALVPAAAVVLLVLGLLGYGAVRCRQFGHDDPSSERVTAGIVQADITHYERLAAEMGTFNAVRAILDTHFALSAEVLNRAPLDFVVWPETVYPTTFGVPKSEDGAAFDREIGAFVRRAGVPLVFGAYDAADGAEFNAAFFLAPTADGRVGVATYRKAELFPLTERVPALLESSLVRAWLPWLGTWTPGTGGRVLPLARRDGRPLLVAPLICYDALDPRLAINAVRRGAELIVTLSNDSWFAFGNMQRLILVVSAFRSIETRRAQVRATNTGISAAIAPTGELLNTIGAHQRAALVVTVHPEHEAATVMLAWGDWFGPSALSALVVLLAVPVVWKSVRPT